MLGYARRLIERSPLLRSRLVQAQADRLILPRGAILAMPCMDRLMRGLVVSVVVLDEFAHFLSESDGPRVADRVWNAVRPSLATFGAEGRLVAISSQPGDPAARASRGRAPRGALARVEDLEVLVALVSESWRVSRPDSIAPSRRRQKPWRGSSPRSRTSPSTPKGSPSDISPRRRAQTNSPPASSPRSSIRR